MRPKQEHHRSAFSSVCGSDAEARVILAASVSFKTMFGFREAFMGCNRSTGPQCLPQSTRRWRCRCARGTGRWCARYQAAARGNASAGAAPRRTASCPRTAPVARVRVSDTSLTCSISQSVPPHDCPQDAHRALVMVNLTRDRVRRHGSCQPRSTRESVSQRLEHLNASEHWLTNAACTRRAAEHVQVVTFGMRFRSNGWKSSSSNAFVSSSTRSARKLKMTTCTQCASVLHSWLVPSFCS